MEEHSPEDIPNETFEVFEKMDGSLGIIFFYDDEWILASRGSFTSEQAIKGNEMLANLNTEFGTYPEWTYMAEIIYPENRIVVNYGNEEKLVILAAIHTETGKEGNINNMTSEGFEIVKRYSGYDSKSFWELKSIISAAAEGFVLKYRSGFRMKIKGEEYIRLHRIVTGISNITIWEYMKDRKNFDSLLNNVPDEFFNWVKEVSSKLNESYFITENYINQVYVGRPIECTRKEYAEWVKTIPNIYSGILFRKYEGRDYSDIIWKLIKPSAKHIPFVGKNS